MSKLADGVFYATPEPARECQFCHEAKHCRPYGPGNRDICYECGQMPQYKPVVEARMRALFKQAAYMVTAPEYVPPFDPTKKQ